MWDHDLYAVKSVTDLSATKSDLQIVTTNIFVGDMSRRQIGVTVFVADKSASMNGTLHVWNLLSFVSLSASIRKSLTTFRQHVRTT